MDHGRRRGHPGDPPTRPHDDRAVHAFAQDSIRTADVTGRLGRDGGGLQPQTRLPHGGGGLADDLVGSGATIAQGQVEPHQVDIEPDDCGVEHPQGFIEQFLPGLVAVAHDDLAAR